MIMRRVVVRCQRNQQQRPAERTQVAQCILLYGSASKGTTAILVTVLRLGAALAFFEAITAPTAVGTFSLGWAAGAGRSPKSFFQALVNPRGRAI